MTEKYQPDLFMKDAERRDRLEKALTKPTIQARFDSFDANNPHVFGKILRLANVQRASRKRVSMKLIFELLRLDPELATLGEDGLTSVPFKISNDFTALYARRLIKHDATFHKYIRTKPLRSK